MNTGKIWLVSDRLLFRKTFSRLLAVMDKTLDIVEHTEWPGKSRNLPDLTGSNGDVVLLDAGSQTEAALIDGLLNLLTQDPDVRLIVVLDEQNDAITDAAMQSGAQAVMIKAAPPQVLVDSLQRALAGERCRPAPAVVLEREDIPQAIRQQLSARQQKLLRLMIGGHSITATAKTLGLTPAKVVTEMRKVLALLKGR